MKTLRVSLLIVIAAGATIIGILLNGCASSRPIGPPAAPTGVVGISTNIPGTAPPLPAGDEELWIVAKPPASSVPTVAIQSIAEIPIGAGVLIDIRGTRFTPLKLDRSDISAQIDGAIAAVDVHQRFINPFADRIEAAYAFPLPANAAVNEFVMSIGSRHIRGIVRESAEAQRIYREARAMGFLASLIVQKSPGVFLQRVANLEPSRAIDVEIRYVHTVPFRDGWFEFVCPLMVRPIDRGTPPPNRSGRDLALSVHLNAGIAIDRIESPTHSMTIKSRGSTTADISLTPAEQIPNADFVLRFQPKAETVEPVLSIERDGEDGTFALLIVPPAGVVATGLSIDWHGADVTDILAKQPIDLYPGHPLLLMGRYHGKPPGTVTFGGQSIAARPAELGAARQPLACIWAERKLARMARDTSQGAGPMASDQVRIALEYGLESPYTSFIMVDAGTRLSSNEPPH